MVSGSVRRSGRRDRAHGALPGSQRRRRRRGSLEGEVALAALGVVDHLMKKDGKFKIKMPRLIVPSVSAMLTKLAK